MVASRHGSRLRSRKGWQGSCQVKPNSGATKAWCGSGGGGGAWEAWICEFSTVFQARIQTKVKEGGFSDETQLRSNEGLMGVWGSSPRKSLKMGKFWEICSRGPCETQQNLYLPAVGGPFFHNLPSQTHQVPKCKVWRVLNYQIDHFGQKKKYKKVFTPEKSYLITRNKLSTR